jgi:formylglycine-generating enzyme required for sulfatase activity
MFQQDRGSGGPVPAGQISLQAGLVLAQQFQLLEHLGSGGMGHVWRARDARRNADVVLKFLPVPLRGDPAANAAMRQEYQTVWQMPLHPNICGLLELGEDPGVGCFQVMHFLAGRNLRKTLRDCGGPGLSVANVLWVLERVAAALDHAHFHGVVHGDIKPENIMLHAGSEQLHVIDFGLASASGGKKSTATAAGLLLGSPGYLSPERQRGGPLKAACDHWSLAVTTWELLTGGLPAAASPDGLGVADVERVGELSAEHLVFQAVFDRAFAAESDDRYQTCLEFVESMRGAAGIRPEIDGLQADGGTSSSGSRPGVGAAAGVVLTSVPTRLQPVRRKYRSGVILAVLGGVVLTAAFFWRKPDPVAAEPDLVNSVSMPLVLIQPGKFLAGADHIESVFESEQPRVWVRITQPFYLGQFEVTQKQWIAVMKNRPWRQLRRSDGTVMSLADVGNSPAVGMTWEEAVEFCRRLSDIEGRTYRLPTEFEWEYACREGSSRRYCFEQGAPTGAEPKELQAYCVYSGSAEHRPEELRQSALRAGTRLPNSWRLYDMHGCVQEFCLDEFSPQVYDKIRKAGAADGYADPTAHNGKVCGLNSDIISESEEFKANLRVTRGGSFLNTYEFVASTSRLGVPQNKGKEQAPNLNARDWTVGFRVLREVDSSVLNDQTEEGGVTPTPATLR